jgi:hypothetical protein
LQKEEYQAHGSCLSGGRLMKNLLVKDPTVPLLSLSCQRCDIL